MTKKFYFLITLLSIVASPLCHGMKNGLPNDIPIQQATILARITAVENPRTALYLTEDHALINGKNECSIIDIRTNKIIKKISNKYSGLASHISVHPNLKKFTFCSDHDDQHLTIYDSITYNPECTITYNSYIYSSSFSPLETTIALNQINNTDTTVYNYTTNESTIIACDNKKITSDPIISFHPTAPLMYLAWKGICTFNLETSGITNLTIEPEKSLHKFLECSPDGLFIVRGTGKKTTLTSLDTLSSKTLIDTSYTPGSWITNTSIHPNSKIIITFSKPTQILHYWEIKTSKLISTTTVPSDPTPYYNRPSLSICPSGTNLLVVINGECMEIAIPFEARYKDLTKEKGAFAHFALQHYLHNGANQLSADIRHLLITALLKASEY